MSLSISVIICTYNRDQYIYRTLEKVASNDFSPENYEIILVNNNSTDRTASECKRFCQAFPQIRFRYILETNQGLSFARNRGILEARGNVLVFLDDDAFIGKDYFRQLTAYLEAYPSASAFGGKITPLYESGIPPVWMSKWSYSWVSALDKGQAVCRFTGRSYPIGANMGFLRTAIPEGGFNTALGRNKGNLMGGEEKDIFNRMKATNAEIYYFPRLEVQHVIPEKRTTPGYIRELAFGIGRSERLRTLGTSLTAYIKRLLSESLKWGATAVLWFSYLLRFTPQKGNILVFFRWYVSKGLLGLKH